MPVTADHDDLYFDDDACFGCGRGNANGLHLKFREVERGVVECTAPIPTFYAGGSGVVHGGIQAAVLDEIMGKAVQSALAPGPKKPAVTADFALRYLRPVPITAPLRTRAEVERIEGREIHVRAAILDPAGTELTTATARWKLRRD